MELRCAFEGTEHRNHLLEVRNHRQQFVYIHINHMVVHSEVQVTSSGCTVHRRQLQFGSPAYETHLIENEGTILDIQTAFQVFCHLVEDHYFLHVRSECQIHIGRYQEWTGLRFFGVIGG